MTSHDLWGHTYMLSHNVSIVINFHQNRFITQCDRKIFSMKVTLNDL